MARAGNADTTYIINFWASWCGPCVKELPQFTELQNRYKGRKVKVLLVSLDFPDSYPAKLETYVEKKKIEPEVIWFSETNANEFIPKIDKNWSGSLPGTMVINRGAKYKLFLERMITADEIADLVANIKK
jgi:thiol-disulfide isomerase/thioredoxin